MHASNSSTQTDMLKWSALFLFTSTLAYTGYSYITELNNKIGMQEKTIKTLNEEKTKSNEELAHLKTRLQKVENGKKNVVNKLRIEKIIKNLFKLGTLHLKNENFDQKIKIERLTSELEAKKIQLSSANKQISMLCEARIPNDTPPKKYLGSGQGFMEKAQATTFNSQIHSYQPKQNNQICLQAILFPNMTISPTKSEKTSPPIRALNNGIFTENPQATTNRPPIPLLISRQATQNFPPSLVLHNVFKRVTKL